jgi:Lon protease-like protein
LTTQVVPLFPLRTVLLPGGPLPLRLFEPRYIDMVSRCMKNDAPFGVVLIADGSEVGGANVARTAAVGTLARIADWYQGTDGLLGITALGTERFSLLGVEQQQDGLNVGEVELLPPEASQPLPEDYIGWPNLLRAVIEDLGRLYELVDKRYDDASWVSYRFAEILPLDVAARQRCLEMDDPLERLSFLRPMLRQVREGDA